MSSSTEAHPAGRGPLIVAALCLLAALGGLAAGITGNTRASEAKTEASQAKAAAAANRVRADAAEADLDFNHKQTCADRQSLFSANTDPLAIAPGGGPIQVEPHALYLDRMRTLRLRLIAAKGFGATCVNYGPQYLGFEHDRREKIREVNRKLGLPPQAGVSATAAVPDLQSFTSPVNRGNDTGSNGSQAPSHTPSHVHPPSGTSGPTQTSPAPSTQPNPVDQAIATVTDTVTALLNMAASQLPSLP